MRWGHRWGYRRSRGAGAHGWQAAARRARSDMDAVPAGVNPTTVGMQPLTGSIPTATPAPGESRVFARPDGAYQAIPDVKGRTKTIHLVERQAPWTLKPGLTVLATTYNGVVPGPAIVVNQGDTVVIDYRNLTAVPDSIHMHGIHEIPLSMDGVAGLLTAARPARRR